MMGWSKIGFIGGGNMAEAILRGLLKAKVPSKAIIVSEPNTERRDFLAQQYGVTVLSDNPELVDRCELIVLAVKPQVCSTILDEISEGFGEKKLLVSILAGISTATLEQRLGNSARVIRVMPNTPALVGAGATAVCRGQYASSEDLVTAKRLFETVGVVKGISESQMDAVTGLSGSGPAYIFTVIEAMADGAVKEGLPRETALALAVQTALGAASLVQQSGDHPAILRDKVCSPGGTTIAGVCSLEQGGLRAALMEAVASASRRSRELGGN